jgi:diaminohydroxyphosphoribosylaminopyrimidine deaminase / 5-amino-6-(5-phosphoribosylamino)uracil reductase
MPSNLDARDAGREPMLEALELAAHAIGLSEPNPRVGCVIVAPDGRVIGRGFTQAAGQAHAEVMALRDAQSRGERVAGATVHVSLEPCSHHGRTPPCCDALIAAGVARVEFALRDPNPQVCGAGEARLRAAGIDVRVGPGADASRELNIGFFSRMQRGRPWVRLKAAVTLDGRTALPDGTSQWITGEAARADGHLFRKRAGAVLTGVGTVLDDDPRLDVRHVQTALQPRRVIVDSRLDTPLTARILQPPGAALLYAAAPEAQRIEALRGIGAEVRVMAGAGGKVDLARMLDDLAQRGVNELHVEAGHKLNGSFVREDLVDEFLIYMAPKLFGQGRELAAFGPLERIAAGPQLHLVDVARVGADLRIVARRGAALD